MPSQVKRFIFGLIFVALYYAAFEALCWAALRFSPFPRSFGITEQDVNQLHRSFRRIATRISDKYDFHPLYGWLPGPADDNVEGLRSVRPYPPEPAPGVLRVALFGDSFVYGEEVTVEDCWPRSMEIADPNCEALNFGVCGYGLDQAYLRFLHEAAARRPSVVVMGAIRGDDSRHLVNFLWNVGKPRFRLVEGELELVPNPLKSREDYLALSTAPKEQLELFLNEVARSPLSDRRWVWRLPSYRAYQRLKLWQLERAEDEEGYQLTLAILKKFHSKALEMGMTPIVVLMKTREDERWFKRLQVDLAGAGVRVLDMRPVVSEAGRTGPVVVRHHYSGHVNRAIAAAVLAYIRESGLYPSPAPDRNSRAH